MTININDLLIQLAQDPNLKNQLLQILGQPTQPAPQPNRFNMGGCPDLDRMTLVQATLFDNGPRSKVRYVVTVEAWTHSRETINLKTWQWKKNIGLIHSSTFKSRIDGLLKRGSITPEYHATLTEYLNANTGPECYLGLLADKSNGTKYIENQFAVCAIDSGKPIAAGLYVDSKELIFEAWSPTDLKGNPLKGTAKYQCRLDRCEFHEKWGT